MFKEILSRKRAEKNLLEVKTQIYKKNEKSKNDKNEYEKNIIEFNNLEKEIKKIEENSKNIWVPPPKYIKEIKKLPNEIISFDKSEFKIHTKIERIDNINESLNLIISFVVNQEKTFKKKVELKKQNSCKEWKWTLSAEEWMNIDNNISNFILGIEIDNNSQVPKINVDISKIKNGKIITFNQQINDNDNKEINISILPIIPEGEKTTTTEEKEMLFVKKLYPPFELKPNNDYIIMKSPQIDFKHSKKNQ